MLKTKSFLDPIESSDGVRISIVGKHEWKSGIMKYTKLTEIRVDMYDEWLKIVAPPKKLVGDLYIRNKCSHEQFKEKYLRYIEQPQIDLVVRNLAHRSLDEVITLLCLEPSPENCHRRYLAEQCKKYEPNLYLSIR